MSERTLPPSAVDWSKLIEQAITTEGDLGSTYNRFHDYSFLNMMLLMMQGVREPVASYNRWKSLGRQVMRGERAKEIIVPIIVNMDGKEPGEKVEKLIGFKQIPGVFGLSQTVGKELPPAPIPGWDFTQALGKLAITDVPFEETNGNMQGYSRGREMAINPVAVNPDKTRFHEIGHIVLEHTDRVNLHEYAQHRGIKEFQAEATAYICMNELGRLDEDTATRSRGYIQHWLDNEKPPDNAIRQVFSATERILRAGRIAQYAGHIALTQPEEA
ncbi:MAG TPA: ArdC family protein [Ktedonobacterales bacterium]